VDLLVVMDSKEPMSQRIRRVTEVAKVRFLPMDIVVRTPAEIDDRLAIGDFFIADILSTGKVLYQRVGLCDFQKLPPARSPLPKFATAISEIRTPDPSGDSLVLGLGRRATA
jgi:hypothetical protein